MQSGDGGDTHGPGQRSVEDVGSVAVGVDHVRLDVLQQTLDDAAFLEVPAGGQIQSVYRNAGIAQRAKIGVVLGLRLDHPDYMHLVSLPVVPDGQAPDDTLGPRDLPGSDDMDDREGIGQCHGSPRGRNVPMMPEPARAQLHSLGHIEDRLVAEQSLGLGGGEGESAAVEIELRDSGRLPDGDSARFITALAMALRL